MMSIINNRIGSATLIGANGKSVADALERVERARQERESDKSPSSPRRSSAAAQATTSQVQRKAR